MPRGVAPPHQNQVPVSLGQLDAVAVRRGDRTILEIPKWDISSGGCVTALIGPNGAGKTTLLRLLQGLIEPTLGNVVWAGPRPPKRAILLQAPVLLRRTALANIEFILKRQGSESGVSNRKLRRGKAMAYLLQAGLADSADRPARQLSGGQQRRLAFAQVLAQTPDLLLLDEPTAGLDPAAADKVEQMIAETAAAGIPIILSSHELGQVRRLARQVLFLNAGKPEASGALPDIFDAPGNPILAKFLNGDLIC